MDDRISRNLPYVALLAASLLVVVLGVQKRRLDNEVGDLRVQVTRALREPVRGMYMPAFNTATLDGRAATIGSAPGEGRQVLFVYTTTCRFCLASLPSWKQIAGTLDTLSAARAEVYGVSLDSVEVTRKYAQRHALPYPTVRFPDDKVTSMYRAAAVPVTLVLDEQGRTLYSRVGQLSEPAAVDSVIAAVKWKPAPRPADAAQGTAAPAS
ncbi:MAG TPA: TlpA disulfide reductase family protein [Longimicrobium sp.]|nr:TlpA disulfide reductase family protein [Longimicrobium sp.]